MSKNRKSPTESQGHPFFWDQELIFSTTSLDNEEIRSCCEAFFAEVARHKKLAANFEVSSRN